MPLEERMLKFIKRQHCVSETDLEDKFGSAWDATYDSLRKAREVSQDYDGPDEDGIVSPIPGTISITSIGEKRLLDWIAERRSKRVSDWWARGLAIAALIVSLLAVIRNEASIQSVQSTLPPSPSVTVQMSADPTSSPFTQPSPDLTSPPASPAPFIGMTATP